LDGKTVEVVGVGDECRITPKGARRAAKAKAMAARRLAWRTELDDLSESEESAAAGGDDGDEGGDVDCPIDDDGDPVDPLGDLGDGLPGSSIDGTGTSVNGGSSTDGGSSQSMHSRHPIEWTPPPSAFSMSGSDHSSGRRSRKSPPPPKSSSNDASNSSSSSSKDDVLSRPPSVEPLPVPELRGAPEVRELFAHERMRGRIKRDGMVVKNGFIVYDESLDQFLATCVCKDHGKTCRKARSAHERRPKWQSKPAQGRPLGFLTAWLLDESCANDFEHGLLDDIPFPKRLFARTSLPATAEKEELRVMLEHERPPRGGEGIEPVDCP